MIFTLAPETWKVEVVVLPQYEWTEFHPATNTPPYGHDILVSF